MTNPSSFNRLHPLSLLLALLASGVAWAQPPQLQAVPLGGEPFAAEVVALSDDVVRLRRDDGQEEDVPLDQFVSWGRRRDFRGKPQALLHDGGVLVADLMQFEPHQLRLGANPAAFGSTRPIWLSATLPRGAVAGALLQPPADALERDRLAGRLRRGAGEEDELWIDDGNSVKGRLLAIGDEQSVIRRFPIRIRQRELTIEGERVRAVRFGKTAGAPRRGAMLLGFREGSLVATQSLASRAGAVHLRLACGGSAAIEEREFYKSLCLIRPLTDDIRYLSDQPPAEFRHQPFLQVERPLQLNRSVLGGLPRWQDQVFSKSLGVSSTSFIVYVVPDGWSRFAAEVALDRTAAEGGSVEFRVFLQDSPEADWSPAARSPLITGGQPPHPLTVELKGAKRLAMVVDYGHRADTRDYANWLNARLEK